MNIKKRLTMKMGEPFKDSNKYFIQNSFFIASLMFLSMGYSLISPFLLIYLILALPLGSLLYNFIVGILLVIAIPYSVYFIFCILTPLKEITKEEYEKELKKLEKDKSEEKKKSIFQKYKDYKKYKIKKGYK